MGVRRGSDEQERVCPVWTEGCEAYGGPLCCEEREQGLLWKVKVVIVVVHILCLMDKYPNLVVLKNKVDVQAGGHG